MPRGLPAGDLWVFGYGSLMWNPGFEHVERVPARVFGLHRDLCVWSWVYRGTERRPGLVLGLDLGGCCAGVAFRVSATRRGAALAYLHEREMVRNVYRPTAARVRLTGGRAVVALTYRADRASPQYAGRLSLEEAARIVARARGREGPNDEYVVNTARHLESMGIPCARLRAVCARLAAQR